MNKLLFLFAFMLLSSGVIGQTYFVNENFNSLTPGSTPPAGWTNNMITGNAGYDFWRFGAVATTDAGNLAGRNSSTAPLTGLCAIFDSDWNSASGGAEDVALETQAFNTNGNYFITLKWDQYFRGGFGGGATVEVFNGTSWVSVYTTTTTSTATQTIDISTNASDRNGVKVRFRWTGNYSWYWMIDNIQVYATHYSFIKEPFTTASGSTAPAGWTTNLLSGSASFDFFRFGQSGVLNSVGNPASRTAAAPIAGTFALFDSDNTSSGGGLENVALESPTVNTSGFSNNIFLRWDQFYRGGYQSGDSIAVEVFDGTSWTTVYSYIAFSTTGAAAITNSPSVNVTSLLANKTNAKVRFRFRGNWSWWWIIDNVELYAPSPTPVPDFTINSASQCLPGNSFTFTNTSTIPGANSTMTYSWNFGDLTTSTATSPSGKTYASANNYSVTLTATSNLGVSASTQKTVSVITPPVVSVSIVSNDADNTICAGTNVLFTATPTNGGTTPMYQWKKNNINQGAATSSNTFNSSTLANGDVISVDLISNVTCAPAIPPSSNVISMTVIPIPTPSVTIASNAPSNISCVGTNVTFTATPTAGGASPMYQWKKNTVNQGAATSSNTYNSSTLVNGDVISVEMVSNATCAPTTPVASNNIAMTVNPIPIPSVSIASNASANTACAGANVTFTATPTNGGAAPMYQWKKNNLNEGAATASNTYSSTTLVNGDVISVTMVSNMMCASVTPVASNNIAMTIIAIPAPSVTIASDDADNITCPGSPVVFTATPTEGGTTPMYQWKKNNINQGAPTTSNTYSTTTLANGDVISVAMTSNKACAPGTPVNSNNITMTVVGTLIPSVTIVSNDGDNLVCPGAILTYTATPTNGGATPVYQWKVNNVNQDTPTTSNTFIYTVNSGLTVTAEMTTNVTCAPVTSNTITMVTYPVPAPSVSIASNDADNIICPGATVTFTATPVDGGNAYYQWKKNNVNQGAMSHNATYIDNALAAGDVISVTMISNMICGTGTPVNSNNITMNLHPVPTVNTVSNQTRCNGFATAAVNFTGAVGGTVYNWVNNTTSIGLGASGSGNIASFAATNSGTAPVTATVTVTPTANGCFGTPKNFDILVNPTPTVNAVADQTSCNGFATTAVTFGSATAGTTYAWTNNTTSIGLGASGSGNIASFTATNSGTAPVTATVSVTPTANTCIGPVRTYTYTVNPTPTVNAVANQTNCNGTATTAVTFGSATAGTTYAWTNNTTSIGLGTSGSGNIASFTATNSGSAPVTATVSVTPTANTCVGPVRTYTYTVNPTPGMTALSNQTRCNGFATAAITMTGSSVAGTVYNWTNSATSIGLAASGTGDIASFTATNSGTAPVVATITATPTANSCNGTARTMTITVNPTPTVNAITNQTNCNGTATTAVTLSSATTGTTYAWTNNTTSIGLGASGSTGTIASFTATNTGTSPVTATVSVTPTANTCVGPVRTYTYTVNPTPSLTPLSNQALCNGASTAAITLTGSSVAGTTYNWTNSATSIGLAASGSGNIASFTATNSTAAPVVATITATPTANSCNGTARTMTITVNPTPVVTTVTNKTVCNNNTLAAINFASTTSGATYSWTNSDPSIGLAASGNGNIAAFTALNPGTAPVVATVSVAATANSCTGAAKTFTITVNPTTTPTISIVSDKPNNEICAATNTTFTATITNGGSTPAYQWKKNGNNVGTNSPTYSDNGLINGDVITCVLTSNITCPGPTASITSNSVIMDVQMYVYHSITISSNRGGDTICDGAMANFTSTILNGGSTPVYQWKRNNNNVGGNSPTYNDANLNTGDEIRCELTSNVRCPANGLTSSSNKVYPTVIPPTVCVVTIIGIKTSNGIMFHSLLDNGGTNPDYQWLKNNQPIPGARQSQYLATDLEPNDVISLTVEPDVPCNITTYATSNTLFANRVLGVEQTAKAAGEDKFNLYPNPNEGRFTIEGSLSGNVTATDADLVITNAVGQVVHRAKVDVKAGQIKASLQLGIGIADGTYMLSIVTEGHAYRTNFVVLTK